MTREEASFILANIDRRVCDDELNEALDMAIMALEQEPSGDLISRDFQIGDEVRIIGSDPIYDDCDVGWVIRNASKKVKTMYVMRNDGRAGEEEKTKWYKTGRHNAMLAEVIKALPSVKQEPKTGHLEWVQYDYNPKFGNWHCSECRCVVVECVDKNEKGGIPWYKYCPQCGAKMVEPQESEEV